ncbi:gap junction beta-7 protein isoform X2 [Sturnira hondurensis]|uniref:gap junction beta-7 protein isoform X2 n=1 Tax=Sturnira hondurensis TaxID=192404 RepID=UPI00187ABB14|nr:gap junction beta-7 protein isoform X2 [Sturnira hondurensis]
MIFFLSNEQPTGSLLNLHICVKRSTHNAKRSRTNATFSHSESSNIKMIKIKLWEVEVVDSKLLISNTGGQRNMMQCIEN